MADTTKTLQENITKMKAEYEKVRTERKAVEELLLKMKMEKDRTGTAHPQQKQTEDQKDKIIAKASGLSSRIKAAETALKNYVQDKKDLKTAKTTGAIDKDEYTRRKNLSKEFLKDVGIVRESTFHTLEDRKEKKTKQLDDLVKARQKAETGYTAAKKFVDTGFKGDSKKIADECQKHFGKRDLTLEKAKEKLRKLDEGVKLLQKEERILKDEVARLTVKLKDAVDRIKQFDKDIARSLKGFQEGALPEAELHRIIANFKKTNAIKF